MQEIINLSYIAQQDIETFSRHMNITAEFSLPSMTQSFRILIYLVFLCMCFQTDRKYMRQYIVPNCMVLNFEFLFKQF